MNVLKTNKQVSNIKGTRKGNWQNNVGRQWLLVNAGLSGQRWVLSNCFQEKSSPRPQSRMVRGKRRNWEQSVYRSHLSSKELRQSRTSARGNAAAEYIGEQQKYSGIQCKEDAMQKRASIRQNVSCTQGFHALSKILFYLPSREDKETQKQVEAGAFTRWGLMLYV